MKLLAGIGAAALLAAGCGNSGIEGTLGWERAPRVEAHHLSGVARNTTSHSVTLSPRSMRLLDADGHKVAGRIRVSTSRLAPNASATVRATWKSGKPVRIDYGSGTLPLTSG